jgi:acetyltransferase-like isoleucine patch superfamily enzyme
MDGSYFRHPQAIVESTRIGPGTKIWAFAHVLPGAVIGRDCNICDHVFIENDVVIGDRVTIKCGVQLWDGLRIEDDVFIGPNATFTNDRFPRSGHHLPPGSRPATVVKRGVSIGANATILPGIIIGENAMVGAGAVVHRNVPRNAIVFGNPATISSYVDAEPASAAAVLRMAEGASEHRVLAGGARLVRLPGAADLRGNLVHATAGSEIPFDVRRIFFVYAVPSREVRGEHAHRTLHQLLISVHGSCHIIVDDGRLRDEILLDDPSIGLYIPPMVWSIQYKFSTDAVLAVLTSAPYDPVDYIRDYDEYLDLVGRNPSPPLSEET